MTPVALSPLNPALRIRNSQTDPDLRVKRGKFYKITGHLRNYTFHGMLVAFHRCCPTDHRSFHRDFPFFPPSPFIVSIPSSIPSVILLSSNLPRKKERARSTIKIVETVLRWKFSSSVHVVHDDYFFL